MATKTKAAGATSPPAAAPTATAKKAGATVRVRAVRLGFYGLKRRRPGEVFDYQRGEGQKLPSWVEAVAPAAKEKEPETDPPKDQDPKDPGGTTEPVI